MSKHQNDPTGKPGPSNDWSAHLDQAAVSDSEIQRVHDRLAREKEQPRNGFPAVPIFMIFLMSGLILFGAIYSVLRSDDYDPLGYDETRNRLRTSWAGERTAPAEPDVFEVGRRLYVANCAACHQQSGEGLAGVFPPLNRTDWVTGSEERLIKIILNGLMGPIEVRGNTYNGVMTPFRHLSDEQIAAVSSYIRRAWDNDAGEVTPETVAGVRSLVGGRTTPFTAAEL